MIKQQPNPFGKKGKKPHQEKVEEVRKNVRKKGLRAKIEHFIRLITGQTRYMDVAGIEPVTGKEIEFHQIGKQTKKGLPVKRERDVIEEVSTYTDVPIEFHAYNVEEDKTDDGTTD